MIWTKHFRVPAKLVIHPIKVHLKESKTSDMTKNAQSKTRSWFHIDVSIVKSGTSEKQRNPKQD